MSTICRGGIACLVGSVSRIFGNTVERCGPFCVSVSQGAVVEIRGNTAAECSSGVEISHGEPLIRENTIRRCARGIALTNAGGGRPVQGNRLEENDIGFYIQHFSAPEIRGNVILGGRQGIFCFMGAHPLISGNSISGAEAGVVCDQKANPVIDGNLIENNGTGIILNLSSYAKIRRNNLVGNRVQMELGEMSLDRERRVSNKSLRGRQQQNLGRFKQGQDVLRKDAADGFDIGTGLADAGDNWWGKKTTGEMAEKGPNDGKAA